MPHVQQPLWNNLLVHFKDQRVLVEGTLNSLKACLLQFTKPRPITNKVSCIYIIH